LPTRRLTVTPRRWPVSRVFASEATHKTTKYRDARRFPIRPIRRKSREFRSRSARRKRPVRMLTATSREWWPPAAYDPSRAGASRSHAHLACSSWPETRGFASGEFYSADRFASSERLPFSPLTTRFTESAYFPGFRPESVR
jgi:hypothetical protein